MGAYGFVSAIGIGFIAWSSTHLYMCFCAPEGFWGFVQSLIVMDSTFCHILLSLIHHSHTLYGAVMVGMFFAVIGGMSKGVAWFTGTNEGEIPRTVHIGIQRPTREVSL